MQTQKQILLERAVEFAIEFKKIEVKHNLAKKQPG